MECVLRAFSHWNILIFDFDEILAKCQGIFAECSIKRAKYMSESLIWYEKWIEKFPFLKLILWFSQSFWMGVFLMP